MSVPAIALRGIDCSFGAVQAVRGASLEVASGTVHAVVGENGAGKSTLMKIAYGQLQPQAGTVAIKGNIMARHSPARAIAAGVGMVHQHFMLVDTLTVLENMVLGSESGAWLRLDEPREQLERLSAKLGLDVDPDALASDLSVGQRQRVEILKVLWRGCDMLILDEPTAVLTPGEVTELLSVLRELVAHGTTVILVTHKLSEVVGFADDITVMRAGECVAELAGAKADAQEIANAMVGRPVLLRVDNKRPGKMGEVKLSVRDLRVESNATGAIAVEGVSLSVRGGEIVGIAGVLGNGQTELCDAIAGLAAVSAGSVHIEAHDVTAASVAARFDHGLAVVPEDRHRQGLVLDMTVLENLVLGRHRQFARLGRMDWARAREQADSQIRQADIRPPDPDQVARALSGGNQQKIIISRELAREPSVLVACQPTRGVDIGGIEHIHRAMLAARDASVAVLLVSAELTELLSLSDRVLVMYRGRVVATFDADALAAQDIVDRIGLCMAGGRD